MSLQTPTPVSKMTSSAQKIEMTSKEKHRRSQWYARLTYVAIIVAFMSVCAIAVLSTMKTESERQGFRPIHVAKPISFVDYTYVDKHPPQNANSGTPKTAH